MKEVVLNQRIIYDEHPDPADDPALKKTFHSSRQVGASMQQKVSWLLGVPLCFFMATDCMAYDVLDTYCRDYRPPVDFKRRQIERPEPPSCATFSLAFDEYSFQSCRRDMETYRLKVAMFAKCLKAENDRAVEEFNEAVRRFNESATR